MDMEEIKKEVEKINKYDREQAVRGAAYKYIALLKNQKKNKGLVEQFEKDPDKYMKKPESGDQITVADTGETTTTYCTL